MAICRNANEGMYQSYNEMAGSLQTKWQVLRKYSDKTVARDLVQELESYGDPSNVVMSGEFIR